MILAGSCVVSGGIRWFQLVLDRFIWFQAIPRFSKYGTSQRWLRFDVLIFVQKTYFILAFVQTFNHFDSQPLETL